MDIWEALHTFSLVSIALKTVTMNWRAELLTGWPDPEYSNVRNFPLSKLFSQLQAWLKL